MSEMQLHDVCSYEQGTIVAFHRETAEDENWPGLITTLFFDKNHNRRLDTHDLKALLHESQDVECPEGYERTEYDYCVGDVTRDDISEYRRIVNAEYRRAFDFRANVGSIVTPASIGYCRFGQYEEGSEIPIMEMWLPFRFDPQFSLYTIYSPDNPNNYTFEAAYALYTDAKSRDESAVIDPGRCNSQPLYVNPIVYDNETLESFWISHDREGCNWFGVEEAFDIQTRPELWDIQYVIDDVNYYHNDVTPGERADSD